MVLAVGEAGDEILDAFRGEDVHGHAEDRDAVHRGLGIHDERSDRMIWAAAIAYSAAVSARRTAPASLRGLKALVEEEVDLVRREAPFGAHAERDRIRRSGKIPVHRRLRKGSFMEEYPGIVGAEARGQRGRRAGPGGARGSRHLGPRCRSGLLEGLPDYALPARQPLASPPLLGLMRRARDGEEGQDGRDAGLGRLADDEVHLRALRQALGEEYPREEDCAFDVGSSAASSRGLRRAAAGYRRRSDGRPGAAASDSDACRSRAGRSSPGPGRSRPERGEDPGNVAGAAALDEADRAAVPVLREDELPHRRVRRRLSSSGVGAGRAALSVAGGAALPGLAAALRLGSAAFLASTSSLTVLALAEELRVIRDRR